jgi:alkanesulfonate monooxygenase SsuD/methylene tetrahydromethanopterin reductase-like flavin-dependent oxidoreductase (luciferase family)
MRAVAQEIRFGTGMGRVLPIHRHGDVAKAAEDAGFHSITNIDSQNLSRDVYVGLAMAAVNTKRIRIGHGVTNPYTRHPSVTANATATIHELSKGRAFLGIGAGFSSVETMGIRGRPLNVLRDYVEFLRKYLRGERAVWKGHEMKSGWIRDGKIPIMMAAGGPRSIQMAGELADEIMIAGAHPLLVKWKLELIERGAKNAGRNIADIPVWIRSMCYIAESKQAARRYVESYAKDGAMGTAYQILKWKDDPDVQELVRRFERAQPGIIEEFERMREVYDINQMERIDAPLGKLVSDRIIDIQEFWGTSDEVAAQVQALVDIGIRGFSYTVYLLEEIDPEGNLRSIGEHIVKRFRK